MLLTVADEPKIDCELRTSVTDLAECEHWLRSSDGDLDGVYLQFEPEMLTEGGGGGSGPSRTGATGSGCGGTAGRIRTPGIPSTTFAGRGGCRT